MGWQAFYKKLRQFLMKWKIALLPFEVLSLRYELHGHGLCLCGLGLTRWKSMGDALFLVLEYLLPSTNATISTTIYTLANSLASANGSPVDAVEGIHPTLR